MPPNRIEPVSVASRAAREAEASAEALRDQRRAWTWRAVFVIAGVATGAACAYVPDDVRFLCDLAAKLLSLFGGA